MLEVGGQGRKLEGEATCWRTGPHVERQDSLPADLSKSRRASALTLAVSLLRNWIWSCPISPATMAGSAA